MAVLPGRIALAWISGLLALFATPSMAAGDLLVAPTRVILDGARGTEVILNNIGSEPATYRISLELRRMLPDGSLEDVEPAKANAHETPTLGIISYAPRKAVLANIVRTCCSAQFRMQSLSCPVPRTRKASRSR